MVTAGTGEALPGPVACGNQPPEATGPITGDPGKWTRAGWASEVAVVLTEPGDNTTPGEGRATASSMRRVVEEGPDECPCG